ncbi:MAG: response regulator transcription factor [Chloroflexi bacterium]|nr:response regulator transcription factor [Chloroflexota bacterium]
MKPNEPRVLIVDDMPAVRQELSTLLLLVGGLQIVGEAADGREAVALAQARRPDVVLMDLEMPGVNGYEATRQIKTHCPACRVIALTVHGDAATRHKASDAGADEFVVKGAPINILLQAVTNERSY